MENCVNARGIKCQIIREGDNLEKIVVDAVCEETTKTIITRGENNMIVVSESTLMDKDVIGITESVVARAQGNYATVDEIASEIVSLYGDNPEIKVVFPIYSRNRFSMILKGVARAAKKLYIVMSDFDEVGNPCGVNGFTGVNIEEYYKDICDAENCECEILKPMMCMESVCKNTLYCGLHDYDENDLFHLEGENYHTLADICSSKCDWGVLGSNKANEETIKLFPKKEKAKEFCENVKKQIKERTGRDVIVCIYGDGCFKDPVGEIWEFADPITMPAYTDEDLIESTPNEIKVKALADDKFKELHGEELDAAIESEKRNKSGKSTENNMACQGTTPRLYRDLLASLMDLITGSGDRCTPIVYITGYFN